MVGSKRKYAGSMGGNRSASGYSIERRAYPASRYMRQYHPRTANTLAAFGRDRNTATALQLYNRDNERVYGQGRYSIGKNFRKASQAIGLAGAGKKVVRAGAAALTRMMGQGGYTTNSLVNPRMTDVPIMSSAADETGAITVSRREYITDIYPRGGAFQVDTLAINPALEQSFPWLSQIAANYEEYDLLQCVYTFRSTTTDVGTSTNGQCGTLLMATQYNVAAAPFPDKPSMQAYDGAMSCKTTEDMIHGVECDDAKRSGSDAHYTRSGAISVGEDLKSYDHGILNVGLANIPASFVGQSIGELWVSYTVVLRKPKFGTARADTMQSDLFINNQYNATPIFGNATTMLTGYGNSIGGYLTVTGAQTMTYTFPTGFSGDIEVTLVYERAMSGSTPFSVHSASGNIAEIKDMFSALNDGLDPAGSHIKSAHNPSNNEAILIQHWRVGPSVGGVPNVLNFSCPAEATFSAWTQASLKVAEYASAPSTRSLAIGSVIGRDDKPVMVNTSGVIVAVV